MSNKELIGVVISNKPLKTIIVAVNRHILKKKYGKYIISRKTYMVHAEDNKDLLGKLVGFVNTKPISKLKKWRLVKIYN